MAPSFCFIIGTTAYFVQRKLPFTFTAKTRSQSSTDISCANLFAPGIAALLTRMSSLPQFRDDSVHGVRDLTLIGDVHIAVDDVVAFAPKLLVERLARVLKHIEDRDLRAFFDETLES